MTTTQTQIRRDTAANLNAATPAQGELAYDTTNKRLAVGDGSTAGGTKLPNAKDMQLQNFTYSTVGGTANAITLTNSALPVAAYTNGLRLTFKATNTNTGATTVNVDGLGTKNIYKLSGTSLVALSGSEVVSGAIYDITYDGTQFLLSSGGGSSALTVVTQTFTSSGTYTPTAGMKYCVMEVVGGGGSGAAHAGSGNPRGGGGGGGAGGYSRKTVDAATVGASQSVTVASSGGTSSVGSILSATGGSNGTSGSGATRGTGGAAGTGSSGDVNLTGGKGNPGQSTASPTCGGNGGNSYFGGGGSGEESSAGSAGATNTGGGGGGGTSGGTGGTGIVIITEFCS